MKEKRTKILVLSLIVIIAVLLYFVLYAFVIQPSISGYAVQMQNEGYAYAYYEIMQAASQCQVVPLTLGNQTLEIIAISCLQSSG